MEVVMHRFVLAEMNTHRVFSRNSASSRAIPFEKVADRVDTEPAMPWYWGGEQKGMQSGEELKGRDSVFCEDTWLDASSDALGHANVLHRAGLHKSLVNRLLEPFMWHTAIITATEWDNFFWQRCDPAAQPEMKAVADQMQLAYYKSAPNDMPYGAWHLPYIKNEDFLEAQSLSDGSVLGIATMLKQVSTARCARVSYLTHDGVRDLSEDIRLFEKLKGSGHWSPFEHVATPSYKTAVVPTSNFKGWRQYRKEFATENRVNFLPNLPELAQQRSNIEQGIAPWEVK